MPTADSAATDGPKSHVAKFQDLLRELFQFDCADLDFGIYRIMNHKREVVERFIAEQLPESIDTELKTGLLARQAEARASLEAARGRVVKGLGGDAIDGAGDISNAALAATPVGRDYLEARARAGASRSREAVEVDVYNHLTAFFSRYYEDGDFVSRRRYSRKQRYAIPYNGEEVYLHWANADQYYVKTGEHFHNYDWKAPNGVAVRFRVREADVEQDNVKGERRFFLPSLGQAAWSRDTRTLTVPFAYRPLNASEKRRHGSTNQQAKIIEAAAASVPETLDPDALAALSRERRRNGKDEPVSYLEHHLRRYTRRNDSDFFIHKDLRGFLTRELDFYLKNEVLNLDDLAAAGEFVGESWFQELRLIRAVGGRIIDFLAQIEGFQKMLWEKRKFVTETNWCVAMRCVPPELHGEIAGNEAQWAEWRVLGMVGDEPATLFDSCETRDQRVAFLRGNPTLMLDTAHFGSDFTDRLLAAFGDIDGMTDGVLFDSENWQTLTLISERYAGQVKCVYIDPPYNTGNDGFIYRDRYRHSSWLTLIDGRLRALLPLANSDAALFVSIDDNEVGNLVNLVKGDFIAADLVTLVAAQLNPRGRTLDKYLAKTHEYIATFALAGGRYAIRQVEKGKAAQDEYNCEDEKGRYRLLELRNRNPVFTRENRPNLFYAFFCGPEGGSVRLDHDPAHTIEIYPRNSRGEDDCWTWSKEKARAELDDLVARRVRTGAWRVFRKDRLAGEDGRATTKAKSVWLEKDLNNENGKETLRNLFGRSVFGFPKAVALVERCIEIGLGREEELFLDFFSGSGTSGHAVINCNRRDGGRRRFILVEMGEHFDSVVLPRMKKVAFSPEWKNGKPAREATAEEAERSPRLIKYMRLESYEDALDNIGFDERAEQLNLDDRLDGYFLNYMLKWETKDSETLLNPAKLASPFAYRLRMHRNGAEGEQPADVAETFNYLLGLRVRTRRVHARDGEHRYLVFRGETRDAPGRDVAVIWRDTEGWGEEELAADRDFVAAEGLAEGADTVYVNGMSSIPRAKPIEPLFKERMFAGVADR